MASKRLARLNEQLKRELSEMIRTQVRDPRVGLVTITATEVAGDLGSARVFVRVLGDEAEVKESLVGLEAAAPFLRHALGQVMRVRTVPELRFRIDQSLDHARRIEQILSDVIPSRSDVAVDVVGTQDDEAGADFEE
jgi:ribosome-binding factor A